MARITLACLAAGACRGEAPRAPLAPELCRERIMAVSFAESASEACETLVGSAYTPSPDDRCGPGVRHFEYAREAHREGRWLLVVNHGELDSVGRCELADQWLRGSIDRMVLIDVPKSQAYHRALGVEVEERWWGQEGADLAFAVLATVLPLVGEAGAPTAVVDVLREPND